MLTGLLFAGGFALLCILALLRHPIYGLLAYVAAFYVHPPSRWWGHGFLGDVRWALIAAGVTLAALLLRKPSQRTVALMRSTPFWVFLAFVAWIGIQSFWALDQDAHLELLEYYGKFALVVVMICKCLENDSHIRWFLLAHVMGCFYLSWLAFGSHAGGRLDGVGGPGINEANAAALQIITGIFVAASLLLALENRWRIALLAMLPFLVNALVATVSRSGFIAAGLGGLAFNFFAPSKIRKIVAVLSALAVVLFLMLTTQAYWDRISTIKYKGEEVAGVDTGGGRLQIIGAQWRMFQSRPWGCGHMCTTVLSPSYIEARYLSRGEARASHNTFMTMLVDHGIPGAAFYGLMVYWLFQCFRTLKGQRSAENKFAGTVLPAVVASLVAITIGDMFVQYPKLEARFWFVSLLLVLMARGVPSSVLPAGDAATDFSLSPRLGEKRL